LHTFQLLFVPNSYWHAILISDIQQKERERGRGGGEKIRYAFLLNNGATPPTSNEIHHIPITVSYHLNSKIKKKVIIYKYKRETWPSCCVFLYMRKSMESSWDMWRDT
jgi:hypothetical protein